MSDDAEAKMDDFDLHAFWEDWFDHSCRCGFPHPKPGKYGPPPTCIERNGVAYELPAYPGVMGGYDPVPCP